MTQSIALNSDSKKVQFPWMLSRRDDIVYFLAPSLVAYLLYMTFAIRPSTFDGVAVVLTAIYAVNIIHQGATWFHYTDKRNREYYFGTPSQRVKFIVLPIAIVLASVAMGFVYWQAVWLVYMAWSLPHFVQQNAGILLLYHNHKRGEAIVSRDLEMKSQQIAGIFFYLVAIQRLSVGKTELGSAFSVIVGIALVVFLVTIALYLRALFTQVRQGAYLNMPAFLFWIVSVTFFVPFAMPIGDFDVCWILPSLMHWWQYIGLNYVIVKQKYRNDEETANLPWKHPVGLFVGFIAMIVLLQFGSYLFFVNNFPQKNYMHIWNSFFLGLNMVHYLLDGFIWKFREQYNRDAILVHLLNARELKPQSNAN